MLFAQNKSLSNAKSKCCAAHFYRQQYRIRRTSQGEIGILPLDPLCSLSSYIQRSSSRSLIKAGATLSRRNLSEDGRPFRAILSKAQNRPQTPDG